MSDAIDLKRFNSQLLQQQKELLDLEIMGDEAAKTVELDQTRVGRLSRMDALQGQAVSLEIKRRRAVERQQIRAALRRIEVGDFGYCRACDNEIGVKRLEINPATTLCIRCAEKSEAG